MGWPQSLWLRSLLGEVLLREGKDLDEAERQLSAVLTADPNHKRARDRLAQLQDRKRSASPAR